MIAARCEVVTGGSSTRWVHSSSKNAMPFVPTDCGVPAGAASVGAAALDDGSSGVSVMPRATRAAAASSGPSTARTRPRTMACAVGQSSRFEPSGKVPFQPV